MKLFYAPQSPFARKVRAAAIELGLGDRITLEYTDAVPGQANGSFGKLHNPLRALGFTKMIVSTDSDSESIERTDFRRSVRRLPT